MKKVYILISLFLLFIIISCIAGASIISGNIEVDKTLDIFTIQSNKEVYFTPYGYSIDNPNIIVNPYGNSPLTALIMFETKKYSKVDIKIISKDGTSDINYTFDNDKYHVIPIYGLYADYDNTIIISSEEFSKTINIKTSKLPEDFKYVENMKYDNFTFYNNNYPYAIDNNGEVRWYLNSNYYGNITFLDNSKIIIGSDRYNEYGDTISFYQMNLLGKIYSEYLIDNYLGYASKYNDNILVLSDKLIEIDLQTGNIIKKYIKNEEYNYLNVVDNNIILGKENNYYKLNEENILEDYSYVDINNKYNLYDKTLNYNIISPVRYGKLNETRKSDKKISLIKYKNKSDFDINLKIDLDRLIVTNNREDNIYIILDKFLDKRVYEITDTNYINFTNLNGNYTIYFMIDNKIYKTNYYIKV